MEDLDKLKKLNLSWHLQWSNKIKNYYIKATKPIYKNDEEYKRTIYLHRFIMNATKHSEKVHHKDHNPFNNKKYNLEITTNSNNSSDRLKANSNNKTGARNVNLITKKNGEQEYWIQIMKDGQRYKWEFPIDQFDEACAFAKQKRKEIFGEYSGD